MSEHTPGPWWIGEQSNDSDGDAAEIEIVSEGDRHGDHDICAVYQAWEGCIDANARLIAAAPDLLDALQFARPFMAVANLDSSQDLITPIDNAIAKAKGRP